MVPFVSENFKVRTAFDVISSLLFLFFIQQITMLIESIYMLNLLHTSMDSKALGILLLFVPAFIFITKHSKHTYAIIALLMLVCILLSPLLPPSSRIFSSGLGAGLFLLYFGLQVSDRNLPNINWGYAAALATLASITFRALGHSLDISISGNTSIIGLILVIITIPLFYKVLKDYPFYEEPEVFEKNKKNNPLPWLSISGIAGAILFIYFAFSSPGVIARWTEGNYIGIHIVLCISILTYILLKTKIQLYPKFKNILFAWNFIFVLMLMASILLHRVPFPATQETSPFVVGEASLFSRLLTYFMLALSPVIFMNISVFSQHLKSAKPAKLTGPFLLAVLMIVMAIFMLISTNVWGYIKPISAYFRNQFHLPFLLAGILMLLPYFFIQKNKLPANSCSSSHLWSKVLSVCLVLLCFGSVYLGNKKPTDIIDEHINELTLMTYNIQQGVDLFGNKNYKRQLALISEIDPDILCLQESDCSRISGGNSDVVRYFAEKLGFYTYFGPKTVTGTFGTAILSRFPMDTCQTIFTYSNKDEIGTAMGKINVGKQKITIINSHPAGTEEAKMAHIKAVVEIAKQNKMTVALGDYNFRQDSPYYEIINNKMNDAWLMLYADAIGPVNTEKLDLTFKNRKNSGGQLLPNGKQDMKNRIDHIFLSKNFEVVEAHFLPAPESETDHPAHWAVVHW